MKHERNALQEQVFPKLEQLCMQNRFQFQAIDLRWGVSSEAGLDHRTMRICFDELKRAQEISPEPNFLVLLGDRYGWRPLPEEISQSEFDLLRTFAKGKIEKQPEIPGIHGKSSIQILEEWYRCDHNMILADPPETSPDHALFNYILQPRTQNLGDGCDYTRRKDDSTKDTQDWIDIQRVLWSMINAAFPYELMSQRFDRDWSQHLADVHSEKHPIREVPQIARFQASATEQEIWCGALSALNAEYHVIACYREITNRDEFNTYELGEFYNLNESGEFDSFSSNCQSDLKAAIRHRLGKNVPISIPFNRLKREHDKLAIEATETTTNKFCDDVFNRIKPIIERQIEEYWEKSEPSSSERAARELNIERNEHKRFGTERGGKKSFVGREPELQAIRYYLKNTSPWPMVIHGVSGCGKTALLARATEEIPENQKPIIRFIGTTPYSSDIRSLLLSLCQELRERYPREDILPSDTKALQDEFDLQLHAVSPEQPLILFLDALDQLLDADNGRLLNWIPYGQLPPNVKLVVSCLSYRSEDELASQPYIALTKRQLPKENIINIDVLNEGEARILLFKNWLPQAGRKLSDLQRDCIEKTLETKECCQPIYLKVLFEEVRLWRSYDALPKIGKDLPALLHQLFDRLSLEANHGQLLVERVLSYFTASRYGLAESELLEILFDDPDYKAKLKDDNLKNRHELPISATRIPIVIWSRLRFDLAPYLTERAAPGANVLTFYHRQLAEWILKIGLKHLWIDWNPHERLADFFKSKADPDSNLNWKLNPRFLGELPFHIAHAGKEMELQGLFSQLAFLSSRVATNQIYEQIEDYNLASPLSEVLEPWLNFLKKHAQRLNQHPTMLVPLINHEGFHEARVQVTNITWSQPWLYTSHEIMPKAIETTPEGVHVQVIGNLEFAWGRASAISPKKALAFCVERLGLISVIDLNKMQQIDTSLRIRRDRPLVIACSDTADSIAVFYESGIAELYQCVFDQNNSPMSLEKILEFEFYLPESEDPVVVWHNNSFWYQSTYSTISSISKQLPRAVEEKLAENQNGELAALVFIKNSPIIALRQGSDTVFLTSSTLLLRQKGVYITTMCLCGENRIAVVFTNGYLNLFELDDKITLKAKLNIGMVRGTVGWDGSRLLWLSETGVFNSWRPNEDTPTKVQDNQEIFPINLQIVPRNWFFFSDNSILLCTNQNIVVFKILFGGTIIDSNLEEIFGGPVWRTVCKRGKDQWLIEKNPLREVLLGKEVLGRLYCALDGKGWFYALRGYGPGLVIELSSIQTKTLKECPYGLNVVVGDDEGGCWFTDRAGDIYYIDTFGYSHCILKIGLDDVHGAILENCGDYLVWIGYSTKYFPDTGVEPARTLIFFRKHIANVPTLERVGEQFRHPREGLCVAFLYDHVAKRLVTLWVNSIEGIENYGLRIGSVEEFAQWRFQELNVIGLGQIKLVQANLSADGRFFGVVNMAGEIVCISILDGKVITTLSGSSPFTAVVHGCEGSEFWIVEKSSTIYKCKLIEEKK